MKFTNATIAFCASALLLMQSLPAEANCVWKSIEEQSYELECVKSVTPVVPNVPENAFEIAIQGFSGKIPESLFRNRSLAHVSISDSSVELPSQMFSGAVVQDFTLVNNFAVKFAGDANVFGEAEIKRIAFHDGSIKSVPELLFSNVRGLEHLQVIAPVKSLSPKLFSGLKGLRTLDLGSFESNNRVSVPEGLFSDLINLENLELLGLNAEHFSESLFDTLPGLNSLSLNLNSVDFAKISSRLFAKIPYLKTLVLKTPSNLLFKNKAVSPLSQLEMLVVFHSTLERLSPGFFNFSDQLAEISISDSKIGARLKKTTPLMEFRFSACRS
jgi:hypothetical protein